MKFIFNGGVTPDGRGSVLWILVKGRIHKFMGGDMPGICAVVAVKSVGRGISQSLEYKLDIVEGATPCCIRAFPGHPLWPESGVEDAHRRFQKQYGVKISIQHFGEMLMRDFPLAYDRMVQGEEVPEPADWKRSNQKPKK